MIAAAQPQERGRGVNLLLEHCSALARLDEPRRPAFERLEDALGSDFARLLVTALVPQPDR